MAKAKSPRSKNTKVAETTETATNPSKTAGEQNDNAQALVGNGGGAQVGAAGAKLAAVSNPRPFAVPARPDSVKQTAVSDAKSTQAVAGKVPASGENSKGATQASAPAKASGADDSKSKAPAAIDSKTGERSSGIPGSANAKANEEKSPLPGAAHDLQEAIRHRAYEIYVERGRTAGDPYADWMRAEREVMESFKQSRSA